jgi:hypothetical protein
MSSLHNQRSSILMLGGSVAGSHQSGRFHKARTLSPKQQESLSALARLQILLGEATISVLSLMMLLLPGVQDPPKTFTSHLCFALQQRPEYLL